MSDPQGLPPEKFVEAAAKGATKAFIEEGKEGIKALAERLRTKDIRFIQDPALIQEVKSDMRSSDYARFRPYLRGIDFEVPVHMGITLRRIAKDRDAALALREKIVRRFGLPGLHLAQAAQAGILPLLMEQFAKTGSPKTLDEEMTSSPP